MEGAWKIAGNPLIPLSVQQILDCSSNQGNEGCNGGWMDWSFAYIILCGGIESNFSYPYTGLQGNCQFNSKKVVAKFSSYVNVTANSEADLTIALTIAPVATAVNVVNSFEYYSSGIYNDSTCTSQYVEHGIGVVGYGVLQGQQYYILKNSWSTAWGMQGYMLMARNANNMCGVANAASYVIV